MHRTTTWVSSAVMSNSEEQDLHTLLENDVKVEASTEIQESNLEEVTLQIADTVVRKGE